MKNFLAIVAIILSVAALVMGYLAFNAAKDAQSLALADIELEERNTLMTPVYDESGETWSYLAIFEVGVTNQGPEAMVLESMHKVVDGAGFLVALQGAEVVQKNIAYQAFAVQPTLAEIQANPKLINELAASPMGDNAVLDLTLDSGQSKAVRFGIKMDIYDAEQNPMAQMVLMSMRFQFANGKIRVFRRGIPISPLR